MKNLIFFGTNKFAVPALSTLARHFNIFLAVTKPAKLIGRTQIVRPSAIEIEAKKLKLAVISPEKFTDEIIDKIKEIRPDFFVIVDYGKIIPQAVLDIPPYGAINVHPSPLPKYRGASPLQTAILNGEKETAFSIMLIDDKIDHGPILAQKKTEILPDDTYGSLYKRLSELYPDFLTETLKKYLSGEIKPVSQDDSKATFTKMLSREDGKIDWSKSVEEIERMVRAYNPWPGTFTEFKNKKIKILASSVCHSPVCHSRPVSRYGVNSGGNLGDFFLVNKKLAAQCGNGVLILDQVQPEGKKPMTGEEFARGYLKNS